MSFCRREVFPEGILYASRESHYSVFKAARMYRMDSVKVDTLVTGEIDCADFKRKLVLNKDKPAIINVNIGILSLPFSLIKNEPRENLKRREGYFRRRNMALIVVCTHSLFFCISTVIS